MAGIFNWGWDYIIEKWVKLKAPDGILQVDISPGTSGYEEDTDTGTTTAAWADALDWDTRDLSDKTIIITNTDAVNDLDYRVLTRAYYTGQNFQKVTGTVLAGAGVWMAFNAVYSRVIVQVMDTVALAAADYQIDNIGRRF